MKTRIITAFAIAISSFAFAGGNKDSLQTNFVQVTFVPPIGTHGMETANLDNEISLNILAGYNGALHGIEAGGLVNTVKYDAHGAQFAGWGNFVGGQINGAQFAGFANVAKNKVYGGQFAGYLNVGLNTFEGVQASGFANYNHDSLVGGQFTGFANVSKGFVNGFQGAGYSNVAISGFKGAQLSGFANVATDSVVGFQGSGAINVATSYMRGVQASGLINYAHHLKGYQVGFLNVCDSLEGIAIGFMSFAANGYHKLEVAGSETMYAQVGFRSGVRAFYNIVTAGIHPYAENMAWSVGYGIGSSKAIGERVFVEGELIAHQVQETLQWHSELNLWNQIRINGSYSMTDQLDVFAGLSWNIMISQITDDEGDLVGSIINPWSTYEFTHKRSLVTMWPGMNLGIRF